MTLIDLLLLVLIVVVIGYLAHYIIGTFFPAPLQMPLLLIAGVLLLLFLLSQFSPVSGNFHLYRAWR